MGALRIYPSLPRSTPLFVIWWGVFGSQNLPLPPRIYPPFQQIYLCDPPRIYPALSEYNPFQQQYATIPESILPSQKIPPFSTTICDTSRICSSLPEYTLPSSTTIYDPSKIYPSLPEYTPPPPFQQPHATLPKATHPSQCIPPLFSTTIICDTSESTPPSQNIPPLSTTICDPHKI